MFRPLFRVWFDMDGVLCLYNKPDFVGPNPLFLRPGYFLYRNPDKYAIALFNKLLRCKFVEVYIITALPRESSEISENAKKDKIHWLKEYLPDFDLNHVVFCEDRKAEHAMEKIGHKLSKCDILIDDYNVNLHLWRNSGGTSVKYINNCNTAKSFRGFKVRSGTLYDSGI